MAYSTISKPSLHFNTKLYTGNASTNAQTGIGFAPDWLWIKARGATYSHQLVDNVRGATKILASDANYAEATYADRVASLDSDGFTLGSNANVNASSGTYVAWNWKAGTSFTNDASSTGIGSIDSAGSVNTDAGFSITSYTGTGSAATVAHGLGVAPSVYILKNRTSTSNWFFYHKSTGATKSLFLDGQEAPITSSGYFNNTEPTSSVFSIGSESDLSGSSQNMIAYCFAEKKGYSKAFSFVGNANTNGSFCYLGFKPAFVILKNSSAGSTNWWMFDNKRNPHNVTGSRLQPNSSNAESTYTDTIDFLSNGFKLRGTYGDINGSGNTIIGIAFAESPFVARNFVPTTAR